MDSKCLPAGMALVLLVAAGMTACQRSGQQAAAPVPGQVDAARLAAVAAEADQWLTTGRDGGKTHYSPLQQINRDTVARVGFAWEYKPGTNRGMQATPIVVDGVMYTTGVAGRAYALDAATGALIWEFEPALELRNARASCCDIVNRGLAVWKGRVYVGAFEGILYALDARDGSVVWEADTIVDRNRAYSVTGAPQVAGAVVVIGNGGAEYDSRGYVSAYDLDTGELKWRFYTVPGDPSKPVEHPALEMAAKTWDPQREWRFGGGGNAWDGFAYDPELDLVYFGTANGAPWSPTQRSPAGGDNLFLNSIVALHASSGAYAWHYQQVPGEMWDYDATPHLMLATLQFDGRERDVLMQASKNGFFYVLDRADGTLLAADKFVDANWASSIDMATGRPVINPDADYRSGKPVIVFPSGKGAHNHNPMSLSARTGLVYIPSVHSGNVMAASPPRPYVPLRSAGGFQVAFISQPFVAERLPPAFRAAADPEYLKKVPSLELHAALKAWDPVARKVVWEHRFPSDDDNGGVLSTAGGLVVKGSIDGNLRFFDDETGKVLKEIDTGSVLVAAPMTYEIDGVQYIAILSGSGGGGWQVPRPAMVSFRRGNDNRILVFRLDGSVTPIPPELAPPGPLPEPPGPTGTPEDIAAGAALYGRDCGGCHLNAPGIPVPDLRRSPMIRDAAVFASVVRGGLLQKRGMPAWDDLQTEAQTEQIRAHLVNVARQAYEAQQSSRVPPPGTPSPAAQTGGHPP